MQLNHVSRPTAARLTAVLLAALFCLPVAAVAAFPATPEQAAPEQATPEQTFQSPAASEAAAPRAAALTAAEPDPAPRPLAGGGVVTGTVSPNEPQEGRLGRSRAGLRVGSMYSGPISFKKRLASL